MEDPKVSILIPIYNRKQYIEQCVDSALNQIFSWEYEIIIRDNCSNDGTYEFVQEKYANRIEEGKIRLYRNEEDLKLTGNTVRLINDAKGKYFLLLHSDDMLLSHAVSHLYEVAEKTNADVVHESYFFDSPSNGIINNLSDCKVTCSEKTVFDKVTVMSEDPLFRLQEWFNIGTYHDAQYNLFNKDFVVKNDIFTYFHDYYFVLFNWLMQAKVFVKTPICCYIRRTSPYADSRSKYSPDLLRSTINDEITACKDFDKIFEKVELLKNNENLQYSVKAHYVALIDIFYTISNNRNIYQKGLTPELYKVASEVFKKHFGENYFYPMIMFNWVHVIPFNRPVEVINNDIDLNLKDSQS